MATASIEVSGPGADRLAHELYATLGPVLRPGESVSAVEVDRAADLVLAIIGLVFSGVNTAKTVWDWSRRHRSDAVTVAIVFDDGHRVDLAQVDSTQLERELERRTTTTP